MCPVYTFFSFFFFNDTATTEIYTLSLHDALPISLEARTPAACSSAKTKRCYGLHRNCTGKRRDRKSTRLNSSHGYISYAVFCLKKKKTTKTTNHTSLRNAHSCRIYTLQPKQYSLA